MRTSEEEVRPLDLDILHGEEFPDKNYRKIRQLGSGGDGVVYLVRHLPTEQLRAAKCLKTDHPEKRRRELVLMKKLNHPALPKILDVLEAGTQLWLIMEYISGRCIADIPRDEVSPHQFFSIAGQLAEVLIYLHTRPLPILHLDIKPSNVILRPDGQLVLIDFGAAIYLSDGEKAGHYGTPGFAAPEQKEGRGKVDTRADIYGFGALLYYYVFRASPNPRNVEQVKCDKRARKLHAYRFLRKCLSEDPQDRFEDCKMLYHAVCTAKRRYYREKRLRRALGAIGLLGSVCVFALFCPKDGRGSAEQVSLQREKMYMQLLSQAETMGFAQAAQCYEEAGRLCPERTEWCMALIERISVDYLFEREEEEKLKELIYMVVPGMTQTFLEEQKKNPQVYGEVAYRLGMLYWYFYEDTGGKRAASGWFTQALSILTQLEEPPWWAESARIHADMGKYCETLGRKDENGEYLADYAVYWKDLKRLWKLEEVKKESRGICNHIADEVISCIILHGYEVYGAGETYEEIEQMLESVEQYIFSEPLSGDEKESRERQCEAAWAAARRVFGKGETEFEEK